LEEEYRAWQAQLDDYISQWSAEVRKFIEAKGYKRQEGGKRRRKPQPRQMSKCLARSNKSRTGSKATNKQKSSDLRYRSKNRDDGC
jgi:hypothetical protein